MFLKILFNLLLKMRVFHTCLYLFFARKYSKNMLPIYRLKIRELGKNLKALCKINNIRI